RALGTPFQFKFDLNTASNLSLSKSSIKESRMSAVETTGLVKRFGMHAAVDGLDMTVPHGSVYGFLRANGAGKTTTLRLVLGLLRANGGTIRIFGESIGRRAISGVGGLLAAASPSQPRTR